MNVREASERFRVPGCSYAVNRYYVISDELRDFGWTGAGEYWYDGYGGRRTFEEAARLLNLDRWYEYNVLKEEFLTRWTKLKSTLHLAFEELAGAIVGVWDSSNLARLNAERTRLDEDYTAYESAWLEYAEGES